MNQNIILEELEILKQSLNTIIRQMEDLLSSKARNVMWRLFFPAGQFMQQRSLARDTSLRLLKLDTRFREMEEVLEERKHPLQRGMREILAKDLVSMSEKLTELPERAQYMITQVEEIKEIIESNIEEISEK
ncbi:MAG: hypothetical protein ACW98F_13545 [Candidatus Hodarchaeales archaeon]|jgi:hypothetical protein